MKLKHLSLVAQTVLSALMMLSCMGDADPVRQSLDIETNDLSLVIGESSTRVAARLSSVCTWIRTPKTGMLRQIVNTR